MLRYSLILSMVFFTSILHGQSTSSFSGNWEFDKTASSPDLTKSKYDGTVILHITQNPSIISFKETWKKAGEPDFNTSADTYYLDGKERVKKDAIGTRKNSARWSKDKKVITITNLDTQKLKGLPQDFLVMDSYHLSEDGRILTIEQYSKNPVTGETKRNIVYHKK